MKTSEMLPILKMRGWVVEEYVDQRYDIFGCHVKSDRHYRVIDELETPVTAWRFTKLTALRNAIKVIQDESIS